MDLLSDILRVVNEILVAGNAITALALLLYALTFNLRDRVARTFALIMGCVAVIGLTDILAATALGDQEIDAWLRLQWLGLAFLPATYLHFSDALLEATGRPSRGRRVWAVRLAYAGGLAAFLGAAQPGLLLGQAAEAGGVPHLTAGIFFPLFLLFFFVTLAIAASGFWRAYQRSRTRTSRRRMRYLMLGAAGPVLIAYPFLTAGGPFLLQWPLVFWTTQTLIIFSWQSDILMAIRWPHGISYLTAPSRAGSFNGSCAARWWPRASWRSPLWSTGRACWWVPNRAGWSRWRWSRRSSSCSSPSPGCGLRSSAGCSTARIGKTSAGFISWKNDC
jgi:hypothetical protein